MKKLPEPVKWLIILAALGAMGAMMWAVNDRASRVEMPAPDNSFGIYRTAGSSEPYHKQKKRVYPTLTVGCTRFAFFTMPFRWQAGRS